MDWQAARQSRCAQFKGSPRLMCGPELRARQTAELFGNAAQVVDALKDCDFGRWRGMRIGELQKTEPEALQHWLADPDSAPHGGESVTGLCERVSAWLVSLQSTPGHVIAITHPFVIRAALTHVLQGSSFNSIDVEPLSAVELRFQGRWRLRLPGTDPEESL